jgi:D-arabinose 1-dehydrogenase-like Zn-dependent alcohol dehydrogenase
MQFNLDRIPVLRRRVCRLLLPAAGHYAFKVPDVLPDEAIPPVNCALCQVLHGIEYAEMKFGDVVVIQGAGGLGIYAAAVAAEKGASKVISIDKQRRALDMAKKCGATDVIDMNELTDAGGARAAREGPHRRARRRRGGGGGGHRGRDGRRARHGPLQRQVRRHRQHRAAAGELPATKVITQQIHVDGAHALQPVDHAAALDFLVRTRDKYPLSKVVSHSFPLSDVNKAFEFAEWHGKGSGTAATRVILKP